MYLHLFFINSPIFNSEFVEFINKHFDIKDHRFIYAYEDSYLLAKDIKECSFDSSICNRMGILKYLKDTKYEYVFFHSMLIKSLYFIPNRYLKKINWCSWGHDIECFPIQANGLKQCIKKIIVDSKVSKFNSFIAGFKGDITKFSDIYLDTKVKMINAIYPMGYDITKFPENKCNIHTPIRIMVGHSAFPYLQHEKYLDILAQFSDRICLYLVLNYGDKIYAEKIIKLVKRRFVNYKIYDSFIDRETYVKLLNEIDYFVFDYIKQAAFGNILLAMYLTKNIYLNENGVMYNTFKNERLHIKSCQSLIEDINDPQKAYNIDELMVNKSWAHKYLDENEIVLQWKKVFNVLKEETK